MRVSFPPHLRRHLDVPAECSASGTSVKELLADLERQFSGVSGYLLDDSGALRQHVNIFLGDRLIQDRVNLSDSVSEETEVTIMQALSGG
jgi:molybdopterin synthase sulfur carrier subunit